MFYKYNNVVRTIVVETTSPIRLEINGFNRVLNITSSTEKGQLLVEETNLLDQKLDRAIYKIIEYANENEMVKFTGITVTVTGKELKYNSLPETEEYIYKKDLKVRFNNSGRSISLINNGEMDLEIQKKLGFGGLEFSKYNI